MLFVKGRKCCLLTPLFSRRPLLVTRLRQGRTQRYHIYKHCIVDAKGHFVEFFFNPNASYWSADYSCSDFGYTFVLIPPLAVHPDGGVPCHVVYRTGLRDKNSPPLPGRVRGRLFFDMFGDTALLSGLRQVWSPLLPVFGHAEEPEPCDVQRSADVQSWRYCFIIHRLRCASRPKRRRRQRRSQEDRAHADLLFPRPLQLLVS